MKKIKKIYYLTSLALVCGLFSSSIYTETYSDNITDTVGQSVYMGARGVADKALAVRHFKDGVEFKYTDLRDKTGRPIYKISSTGHSKSFTSDVVILEAREEDSANYEFRFYNDDGYSIAVIKVNIIP